jgi:hypothetical protein
MRGCDFYLQIARKAAEAYESLSNLLNDYKYFMKTR